MNRIEEKHGLKPAHAIILFVILVLNIIWLVCNLIISNGRLSFFNVLSLLLFIAAILYALFAYKKPHGNYMRRLLLAYDLIGSIMFVLLCKNQELYLNLTNVIMILLTAYMAGRLDHYKQNVFISIINLVGTIIVSGSQMFSLSNSGRLTFVTFFGYCTGAIVCWLAIAISYIIRYKEHKEAGLQDK